MSDRESRRIVVAGAGIAGLTAALAFARQGRDVHIFEQAQQFETVGAGIQLSPNATRILDRLQVLDRLTPKATQPPAVLLMDAATLRLLARMPLGDIAQRRWGAPYLVVHRADLQAALLDAVAENPSIQITTGARATDVRIDGQGAAISLQCGDTTSQEQADLTIGADGVWSALRALCGGEAESRFSGALAWRATIDAASPAGIAFNALTSTDCVTAFLHSGFHLVAYPVKAGAAFNLVAFTKGRRMARNWAGEADITALAHAMRGAEKTLRALVGEIGPWTLWPVHTVDMRRPWTHGGRLALLGDAAHAMSPFAAQGAAMAIEDAATLAHFAATQTTAEKLHERLLEWEASRRARVAKVARRGALNKLAWNAAGPLALGRNLLLKLRSADSLAADMDWLYGYDAERVASSSE